jgi:hypothetical protein
MAEQLWEPFEKFVDLPYYAESERCGGMVTVSFSKYLPWQWWTSYNAPPTSLKRKRSNKEGVVLTFSEVLLPLSLRRLRKTTKSLNKSWQ